MPEYFSTMPRTYSKNKPTILVSALGEYVPFRGGIAVYAASIVDALIQSGRYKTYVATVEEKSESGKGEHLYVEIPMQQNLKMVFAVGKMWRLIRRVGPDCIVVTHPFDAVVVEKVLRILRLVSAGSYRRPKIVYAVYGTEILDAAESRGLMSQARFATWLKKVDRIIVISRFTMSLLMKHFGQNIKGKTGKVSLVYPTVRTVSKGKERGNVVRQTIQRAMKKVSGKYILSIGRLVKRKGHHIVIKGMKYIPEAISYVIVGTGPEHDNLQKLITKENMESRVHIFTSINEYEKSQLIRKSLFLVQPSTSRRQVGHRVEGFGITIVEAFAQKRTAIIFNEGGDGRDC